MNTPKKARFTKNVQFDEESWDYGNTRGVAVSVGEPVLIRWAAQTPNRDKVLVEPAKYENVKVRIGSLDEVPVVNEDSEHYEEVVKVRRDADGLFYWDNACVQEAKWRSTTPDERAAMKAKAIDALNERLEATYQAGLLLAEGRIEE